MFQPRFRLRERMLCFSPPAELPPESGDLPGEATTKEAVAKRRVDTARLTREAARDALHLELDTRHQNIVKRLRTIQPATEAGRRLVDGIRTGREALRTGGVPGLAAYERQMREVEKFLDSNATTWQVLPGVGKAVEGFPYLYKRVTLPDGTQTLAAYIRGYYELRFQVLSLQTGRWRETQPSEFGLSQTELSTGYTSNADVRRLNRTPGLRPQEDNTALERGLLMRDSVTAADIRAFDASSTNGAAWRRGEANIGVRRRLLAALELDAPLPLVSAVEEVPVTAPFPRTMRSGDVRRDVIVRPLAAPIRLMGAPGTLGSATGSVLQNSILRLTRTAVGVTVEALSRVAVSTVITVRDRTFPVTIEPAPVLQMATIVRSDEQQATEKLQKAQKVQKVQKQEFATTRFGLTVEEPVSAPFPQSIRSGEESENVRVTPASAPISLLGVDGTLGETGSRLSGSFLTLIRRSDGTVGLRAAPDLQNRMTVVIRVRGQDFPVTIEPDEIRLQRIAIAPVGLVTPVPVEAAPEAVLTVAFPDRMLRGATVAGSVTPPDAPLHIGPMQVFSRGGSGRYEITGNTEYAGIVVTRNVVTGAVAITVPTSNDRMSINIQAGDAPNAASKEIKIDDPVRTEAVAVLPEALREGMRFSGDYTLSLSGRAVDFGLTVGRVTRLPNGHLSFPCRHVFTSTLYDATGRVIPRDPVRFDAVGDLDPVTGIVIIQETAVTQGGTSVAHQRSGTTYSTTTHLSRYEGTFDVSARRMALAWRNPGRPLSSVTLSAPAVS